MAAHIYCTKKFNKYGCFISIIMVKGQTRTIIILPENQFNKGWGKLVQKIEDFIAKESSTQGAFITEGEIKRNTFVERGNYKEAITKPKWDQRKLELSI